MSFCTGHLAALTAGFATRTTYGTPLPASVKHEASAALQHNVHLHLHMGESEGDGSPKLGSLASGISWRRSHASLEHQRLERHGAEVAWSSEGAAHSRASSQRPEPLRAPRDGLLDAPSSFA
jgi:hypothetical protein